MYPKTETDYASTPDTNDEIVENIITGTFTRGRAILKVLFFNPSDLIFQHLPVREKVKKTEIKRMGNGYNIDILTSVDILENVELGGKAIQQ